MAHSYCSNKWTGTTFNEKIFFYDHDLTNDVIYNHMVRSGQEFSINTNEQCAHDHKYQLSPGTHVLTFVYHNSENKEVSTTFYVVVI